MTCLLVLLTIVRVARRREIMCPCVRKETSSVISLQKIEKELLSCQIFCKMFASSAAHKNIQNCYYLWNTLCLHLLIIQNQVQIGGDHYMTKSTQTLQMDHRFISKMKGGVIVIAYIYRPQTKFGARLMFLNLCVILFTGMGVASRHASQVTWPRGSASKGVCIEGGLYLGGLPPGGLGRPLPLHGILWYDQQERMINKRAVRILLECILVYQYAITDIRKS